MPLVTRSRLWYFRQVFELVYFLNILDWFYEVHPSHIRFKGLRYGNVAIFLLIVFQDRHEGPSHREPGSIQSMSQFGPAGPFLFESNIGSPGLKVAEVAA